MLRYYVCLFMMVGTVVRAGESVRALEEALQQIVAVKQNVLTEYEKARINVRAEMTFGNLDKVEGQYKNDPAIISSKDRERTWKKSELEDWGMSSHVIEAILSPDETLIKKYSKDDQAYLQTARKFLHDLIAWVKP